MSRILATFTREGFTAEAVEHEDGRVEFTADADIDADGANGQNGKQAAYMVGNGGSEHLANGGMKMQDGRVVIAESWARDIVILGPDGQPKEFPNGVIASKTAYRFPGLAIDNPAAHVDSETVPYIVVPPQIIERTKGAVLGCMARATNLRTGKVVAGVVADVGPKPKVGEVSIEMARSLGIPESPRHGGVDDPIIRYELWPGVPACVGGFTFRLQRSNGAYV